MALSRAGVQQESSLLRSTVKGMCLSCKEYQRFSCRFPSSDMHSLSEFTVVDRNDMNGFAVAGTESHVAHFPPSKGAIFLLVNTYLDSPLLLFPMNKAILDVLYNEHGFNVGVHVCWRDLLEWLCSRGSRVQKQSSLFHQAPSFFISKATF